MNNIEFKNKLVDIANNYKTLYVYGCFGSPLNATNKKRYTKNHSYNKQATRTKMINNASSDTFGFDCVNLIKGVLWGWNGNLNNAYGGAKYKSNGVPDINANGMIKKCNNVSTDFSKIEIGEAVWMSGHIGIYIGNGEVVECTPAWKNKVQITKLSQRKWVKHGKLPYITYTSTKPSKPNSKSFFGSKGYFSYGDNHKNIGKIAEFMYKTFPSYTKKAALGNYYGRNIESSIKEFQKRTGLETDGCVGPITLKELKKYGFKE